MNHLRALANKAEHFYGTHINANGKGVILGDLNHQALICWWVESPSRCQPYLYEDSRMMDEYEFKIFREKSVKAFDKLLVHKPDWSVLYR